MDIIDYEVDQTCFEDTLANAKLDLKDEKSRKTLLIAINEYLQKSKRGLRANYTYHGQGGTSKRPYDFEETLSIRIASVSHDGNGFDLEFDVRDVDIQGY